MKKYIGTKQIEAAPMTLGEFIEKTGRNPYEKDCAMHNDAQEGYLVKYEDGYESWSPKDVFEKAYNVAENHVDRMLIEQADLVDKLEKGTSFLNAPNFREIVKSDYQAMMLYLQLCAMRNYNEALSNRLYEQTAEDGNKLGTFGVAIEVLKFGGAIRRSGWNGKGMFVVKQVPSVISETIIPKMQSLPQSAKDLLMAREDKTIRYSNQMLIIHPDGRADSWVPSSSDIFATDWEIVKC